MACHIGCRRNLGDKNLEELCVSVIASNFDRFLAAYKQPNSTVPRCYLEFLERRYSANIFASEELKRLRFYGKLTLDHLDFFINDRTKELDLVYMLYGVQDPLLEGIINKLRIYGKNILSLRTSLYECNENLYRCLMPLMPNLEKIQFQDILSFKASYDYDENFFSFLVSSAPLGMQLDFRCFPPPKVIEELGIRYPLLKVLQLPCHLHMSWGFWGFKDLYKEDIQSVSNVVRRCSRLEILDFPDTIGVLYQIHRDDLEIIEKGTSMKFKTYGLKTLSSRGGDYPLSSALKLCVVFCPQATSLYIHNLKSDEELEQCSHFTLLKHVTLKWIHGLSNGCLNQFLKQRGNTLISMHLNFSSQLSVATLIRSCPKLQILTLLVSSSWKDVPVCEESESPFENLLPDLEKLEFLQADFSVLAVAMALMLLLSAGKRIKTLSFSECSRLSSEFVANLDLSRIRKLQIDASDINGDSLMELLLHGNLRKLEIRDCLSYEERLNLRNLRATTIFCKMCEARRQCCEDKFYTRCCDQCEFCRGPIAGPK